MKPSDQTYFIYILLCENNSYYTGYTTDLNKRFNAHLAGTASKYTRSFKPVRIAQSWEIKGSKAKAMQVERAIKALPRSIKDQLIINPVQLFSLISLEA